jgi:2,3-bisphosphoglycerate-dependent phosphoglycerate mutase
VTLILVRHALPAVDPSTPPSQWPLSSDGRAAAALLPLPPSADLVASTEPKAVETLSSFGHVVQDSRFGEIHREGEPFDGNFRELRLAYMEGAAHPLWEPHADAVARFDAAISSHSVPGRTLVVGTHGMVLTVWLTARIGLLSPGSFWSDLRFPDALHVDLSARTVTRLPACPSGPPSESA